MPRSPTILVAIACCCALLLCAAGPVRDPLNPLALTPAPTGGNPLRGAQLYADPNEDLAGTVAHHIRPSQPAAASALYAIASQPETKRYGSWDADPGAKVAKYLAKAHHGAPGAVPTVGTYRLHHIGCGGVSDSPGEAAAYKRWYDDFARGIGSHRAIVFYEIDALITTGCLSHHGLAVRVGEMRHAIAVLGALPHTVVYVDAGAADAGTPDRVAHLLRAVGVRRVQGFYTNATHYDWTSREIRYAQAISRRTGGKHFVINTAVNGRGPLVPRSRVAHGNELHCNPPGRGLGPRPTWDVPTRYVGLDGFFWIGNPGRSGGDCGRGDPPVGTFFVRYALMLIRNADYRIR